MTRIKFNPSAELARRLRFDLAAHEGAEMVLVDRAFLDNVTTALERGAAADSFIAAWRAEDTTHLDESLNALAAYDAIGDAGIEVGHADGSTIPLAEAISLEKPDPTRWGAWVWGLPVCAIISDSWKWREWPAHDAELGPWEFRVAQSAIENLYARGYALVKLPQLADEAQV